jgi:hypothetical protein
MLCPFAKTSLSLTSQSSTLASNVSISVTYQAHTAWKNSGFCSVTD